MEEIKIEKSEDRLDPKVFRLGELFCGPGGLAWVADLEL